MLTFNLQYQLTFNLKQNHIARVNAALRTMYKGREEIDGLRHARVKK
jgi:hypothetical protein